MSEPEHAAEQADLSAENKEKLEKLVQKDSRSGRVFSGFWKYITSAMGAFMVAFYMYCAAVPVDTQYFLGVYVVLTYVMVFLIYPLKASSPAHRPTAVDLIMAAAAVFVVGYFVMEYEAINYRMGSETRMDTFVSALGILVSLEVARRALGWSMTIVGALFLAYAFWGDLLQNIPLLNAFAHTGFKIDRALNHIYYKQEGVFGIMATVLVTYVILFIFFGSFLKASGASRFFIDVPMAVAGKSIGGPAKVAVIASGFFGSVSGSAIANTVSTGAFTIPMMKKAGFRPHVAGAIEPSASIGGMFMPPIMGAGGFLMAEMTEIPYVQIMIMAIFPALMYFLSVFTMVHFEAKRYGIVGKRRPEDPTALEILKKQWFMSLPLVI
ncbi:MAG: TRAP transporter fused permease subunit, partial [Desulfococcus multivorans]|nr:TRAP transporter fused permease subunit [Desulfococcus multivorans]